MNSIWSRWMF